MGRIYYIFILIFILNSINCAPVIIAGGAAVGIVAVTRDSATTSVDTDFNRAWKISNSQLRKMGSVDESFQKLGEIKAKVNGADITVKISRLTEKTVDIHVSARKNLLPDMELARAILANIMRNLKE